MGKKEFLYCAYIVQCKAKIIMLHLSTLNYGDAF